MRSTIAMSSLRKDSPRTFLAAHDSAYSKPLSQIGCCIRFTSIYPWLSPDLSLLSRDSSLFSLTFGVRKAAGVYVDRRRSSIPRSLRRWLRASRLHPIDLPGCARPNGERGCPCTRMKTACVAVDLVTPSRVSRRFRGGFSFNAGLRDLGDALSPAKANLLDGNTWVKCSPRMVYGPMVPTSCRHAALPPFSLSFYLAPRVFVPLPPS